MCECVLCSYQHYLFHSALTCLPFCHHLKLLQVEGFEFDVLVAMVNGDDAEKRVHLPDQIVIELHTATRMYDLPWMLRFRQAAEVSLLLAVLYRKGGYLPVFFDFNPGCASCLEVLFVRVIC